MYPLQFRVSLQDTGLVLTRNESPRLGFDLGFTLFVGYLFPRHVLTFVCSLPFRNHTWLCCTYGHCCFFSPFMMSHSNSLRPVYVKIVLLNISISSSTPIFVLPRGRLCTCQYDQAPQLHVNIAFCNRLAENRLKLVSIYPGVLKRGLHIYSLLIYLSLLWCHM